jgi:hypothetical protein
MKNKLLLLINYFRNLYYFLVVLSGTTITSWIIWTRFIRERLPRDIPNDLTESKFYLLLYICGIYLYIIKSLLIPKEPISLIVKMIKILYTPLVTLDESIKNNRYILKIYNKMLTFAMKRVDTFTFSQMKMLYISYNILPRAFLVTLLCINVFYFHKLELIYDFILIGLIPLFHRYIKYSFKYAKEQYIKNLTDRYRCIWVSDINYTKVDWEYNPETMLHHDKELSIEEYVNIQVENYLSNNDEKIRYEGNAYTKEEILIQYTIDKYKDIKVDLTSEDYVIIKKEFDETMPILLQLSISLEIYSTISSISKIKNIRILIYSLYFICWAYILLVSYKGVGEFSLTSQLIVCLRPYIEYLTLYTDTIEPFSGLFLMYEYTVNKSLKDTLSFLLEIINNEEPFSKMLLFTSDAYYPQSMPIKLLISITLLLVFIVYSIKMLYRNAIKKPRIEKSFKDIIIEETMIESINKSIEEEFYKEMITNYLLELVYQDAFIKRFTKYRDFYTTQITDEFIKAFVNHNEISAIILYEGTLPITHFVDIPPELITERFKKTFKLFYDYVEKAEQNYKDKFNFL